MSIIPDPEYDFVKPYATRDMPPKKKGSQCGECGMKFDYGQTYGFCCGNNNCPMGWGPLAFGGDTSCSMGSDSGHSIHRNEKP